jgi:hypothetical protein
MNISSTLAHACSKFAAAQLGRVVACSGAELVTLKLMTSAAPLSGMRNPTATSEDDAFLVGLPTHPLLRVRRRCGYEQGVSLTEGDCHG